jgi:hypothetical protein
MDWRGKLLGPDTLSEAAVEWVQRMRQGSPPEIGVILIVANCRDGTNVLGASANLSREDVRAIVKGLKIDPVRPA